MTAGIVGDRKFNRRQKAYKFFPFFLADVVEQSVAIDGASEAKNEAAIEAREKGLTPEIQCTVHNYSTYIAHTDIDSLVPSCSAY